mgnify:CR=1 FL=1
MRRQPPSPGRLYLVPNTLDHGLPAEVSQALDVQQVLPLGALETHGPHLPLASDTLIASIGLTKGLHPDFGADLGDAVEATDGMIVEPARADFRAVLRNATLSISQAGYNAVVDTLCCADRAVLVPFGTDRETEQGREVEDLAPP